MPELVEASDSYCNRGDGTLSDGVDKIRAGMQPYEQKDSYVAELAKHISFGGGSREKSTCKSPTVFCND